MTWAKVDDGFLDHPKVLVAGEEAANLYLRGLVWCCKHLTDGAIPREALRTLTARRDAGALAVKLVAAGLWEVDGNGWRVHDFHDHNPTAAEVKARRSELSAKRSEAGKLGGIRSGQVRGGEANGKQTGSKGQANAEASAEAKRSPVPSRPVPVPVQPQSATRSDAGVRAREAGRGEGAPPPRAETAPQSPPRAPSVEATGYDAASLISDLQRHASRHLLLGGACDGGTELALSRIMRDLTARGVPAATPEGYRTLAAWIAAGGWAWRDVPAGTGALARPGALLDALGQADAWAKAGRGPVAVRGKKVSRDHVMTVEEADAQIAAEKAAGPAGLVF